MAISTFMGLEVGKRALSVSRVGLDVTAHNIANANTEGYTRQRAEQIASSAYAAPSMFASAYPGQIGTGVEIFQIQRIKLDFFDNRIQHETQQHNRYKNLYQNLQQVELLLNEPSDNGIRSVMDKFWQSMMDLSNDPETPATRRVVIENGIALSNSFSQMTDEMTTLRDNLNTEIIHRVGETNRLVEEIAELNKKIASIKNMNDNPNDLLDRRDLLLGKLSELINIESTYKGTDDELVVSVNGRPIIQGQYYNKLVAIENRDNEDMVDVRWEKDYTPLSSNENILTVFANSSASNQSHTVNVFQLARKHIVNGTKDLTHIERPLNFVENNQNITTGFFEVNGTKIYVDAQKDSLKDVVDYINASSSGVIAKINENRVELIATNSGEDSTIVLKSGTSNFLSEMGLTSSYESGGQYIEKNQALGLNGTFSLNGQLITISGSDTLENVADIINKANIDVHALIRETDSGTYRLVIESNNGNYNYTLDDMGSGILSGAGGFDFNFGDSIPAGGEVTNGFAVSHTQVDDIYKRGLTLGVNSSFELEDSSGNIVTINIDDSNDSLALIAEEIENQINLAGADLKVEIVKDAEGKSRLFFQSTDGNPMAIRDVSGNIIDNLGITTGTYNQQGPVSFDPENAIFNFNGVNTVYQSNRIEGLIPDITFNIRSAGQANIEVRKTLSGGMLKGLLESRDEVVSKYMRDLDKLAYNFMSEVNQAHFEGFGLDGKSQRAFFDIYTGNIDGYPDIGASRSMKVDRNVQLNVNILAAAARDPFNTAANGLPISEGTGSGNNALLMSNLKFKHTMSEGTATFNQFFNEIISDIGTKANEASRIVNNQELLLMKLENVREQTSGVSLDEEMTNMIKFQHAYNAAARIINTVDQMIQTVISLGS